MTGIPGGANINTAITVAGFVIMIGGYLFDSGRQAERLDGVIAALVAKDVALEQVVGAMDATIDARTSARDAQMERHQAKIQAVELSQASMTATMQAIQAGVARIEARLERMQPTR